MPVHSIYLKKIDRATYLLLAAWLGDCPQWFPRVTVHRDGVRSTINISITTAASDNITSSSRLGKDRGTLLGIL